MAKLLLHHEIMLLALRDEEGTSIGSMYPYAVGGALLSELIIQKRIAVSEDKKQLVTVAEKQPVPTPPDSPLMEEIFAQIQKAKRPKSLTQWVGKVAVHKNLKHQLAQELCDLNVLKEGEDRVLWVFPRKIYPEQAPKFEREIKDRMSRLMFGQTTHHDDRTTALVALAKHANLLSCNFDKERLKRNKDRIEKVAKGDMFAARAAKSAIAAIQAAILVAAIIPTVAASSSS